MGDIGNLLNPTRTVVLLHANVAPATAETVVTIAAAANHRWQIVAVFTGYDRAYTSAGVALVIAWTQAGVAQTFRWYPTSLGTNLIDLPPGGIVGDENTAVTFTLTASGGAALGTTEVFYGG